MTHDTATPPTVNGAGRDDLVAAGVETTLSTATHTDQPRKNPVGTRVVALWCQPCHAYVDYSGWVYDAGRGSTIHVTPSMLRAHRRAAHGGL